METDKRPIIESKFTKGEKCIFTHLVVTFTMILILFMIYALHLFMVKHTQYGIFSVSRLSDSVGSSQSESNLVGYLYLNITNRKFVCNTLLLKPRWSLSTSHCVSVRADPDMADFVFAWALHYKFVNTHVKDLKTVSFATPVKRSITHPLFNRETFANNVGLLEHTVSCPFSISDSLSLRSGERYYKGFIIGWTYGEEEFADNQNTGLISYDVDDMSKEKCLEELSPVVAPRDYELCVTSQGKGQMFLEYGAVLFSNSKVIGIFTWGERSQKELPTVIIIVRYFQDWLNAITAS